MHPFDSFMPLIPEGGKCRLDLVEGSGARAHEAVPVGGALGDQPSSLEHRHVSLHRCERHRVVDGQVADGALLAHRAGDDVAARRVSERSQLTIDL